MRVVQMYTMFGLFCNNINNEMQWNTENFFDTIISSRVSVYKYLIKRINRKKPNKVQEKTRTIVDPSKGMRLYRSKGATR